MFRVLDFCARNCYTNRKKEALKASFLGADGPGKASAPQDIDFCLLYIDYFIMVCIIRQAQSYIFDGIFCRNYMEGVLCCVT